MAAQLAKPLFVLLLLTSIPAPPLHAQAVPPEPGTYALSFGFPSSGDASVGIRKMLGSGANAGLNLTFSLDRRELDGADGDSRNHTWGLAIEPDIRLYRAQRGNVLPFLDLNAGFSFQGEDGGDWSGGVSAGAGIGVEWFPVPSMSLSGKTGLSLYYRRTDIGGSDATAKNMGIGTRTSSLSVNLYF